jgi:hypothetical protein
LREDYNRLANEPSEREEEEERMGTGMISREEMH